MAEIFETLKIQVAEIISKVVRIRNCKNFTSHVYLTPPARVNRSQFAVSVWFEKHRVTNDGQTDRQTEQTRHYHDLHCVARQKKQTEAPDSTCNSYRACGLVARSAFLRGTVTIEPTFNEQRQERDWWTTMSLSWVTDMSTTTACMLSITFYVAELILELDVETDSDWSRWTLQELEY